MRLTSSYVLPILSFPAIALAHANGPHHHRQVASAVSSATSSTATAASSAAGSGSASGSTSLLPTPTGPIPTFTLVSTNPTAVPLTSIVVNAPSAPTSATPTPYAVGSKPSDLPNAPGLPDISKLSPANYPPLDKAPPTDSPQVQQWIQQVQQSGVTIPNITVNVAGGCPANPAAAANPSACWWTCGGCTRSTDVTTCPTQNSWGCTYDDGPSPYTPTLLDYLDQVNIRATMFVVGSRAVSEPTVLQREYLSGHQIGVHTWSHTALTTQTNEEIIAELGWTKKVIYDVTGVTPTTMRPPYGDIDDRVRAICTAMNLIPVMWTRINTTATFDTDDFDIHGGVTSVQQVLANWENIMTHVQTMQNGFIVLEHDLFQQTVEVATGYILPDALARKPALNITTVNTCLNKPMSAAYVETNDNKTYPLPLSSYSSNSSNSSSSGSGSSTKKNGGVASATARTDGLAVVAAAATFGIMALAL